MTDQYGYEATSIAAAKILCSLRSRKLVRWPDWLQRPSMEEPEEETVAPPPPLPMMWTKRQRANGRSKAANAWPGSLRNLFGNMAPSAFCGEKDGPAKRRLDGDGDECISPAKHVRADGDRAAQQAMSAEDKVEEPKKIWSDDNRDEKGCLLFDLNEDAPCEES
ncbi:unnamed protein product [Alopecurus aequalis]